jgi:RNA polymerase sigma-70 factor (ECF subfamily)
MRSRCLTDGPRGSGAQRKPSGEELDATARAAGAGDRACLQRLLAWIRPLVLRYCRARLGLDSGSIDDLVQEVCIAVVAALPGYPNQGSPFSSFVYGIAAHKLADHLPATGREHSRPARETPEPDHPAAGPENPRPATRSTRRVERVLDLLPAQQREIVILRVILGFSAAETGQTIGASPTAVRVAQHRALSRLRTHLATTEQAA